MLEMFPRVAPILSSLAIHIIFWGQQNFCTPNRMPTCWPENVWKLSRLQVRNYAVLKSCSFPKKLTQILLKWKHDLGSPEGFIPEVNHSDDMMSHWPLGGFSVWKDPKAIWDADELEDNIDDDIDDGRERPKCALSITFVWSLPLYHRVCVHSGMRGVSA